MTRGRGKRGREGIDGAHYCILVRVVSLVLLKMWAVVAVGQRDLSMDTPLCFPCHPARSTYG